MILPGYKTSGAAADRPRIHTMSEDEVYDGFYARLAQHAQAGEWKQALAMMRTTGLPAMRCAFRTIEVREGRYEMVFRFHSIEEMHTADGEWRAFRSASCDTHPKDGDVKQAPLVSGAVPKADAQKPTP